MNRAERIKTTLFYIVVGGLFTNAVTGAVLSSTYIWLTGEQVLWASFILTAAFCLYFHNKYTFIAITAGFFLCALAVTLYLWHMDFDVEWFSRLAGWVSELASHVRGMTPYRAEYNVLGYLLVALFACFAAIFVRTGVSFYLLSALGFSTVGILSYIGYQVPGWAAVSVLMASACLLTMKMSRSAARREYGENGKPVYTLSTTGLLLLPICLVILIAANFIPAPAADSGSNMMHNFESNLFRLSNFFMDRFGPKYFSFSTTGFSQSGGRLGGNITPNSRHVMDVYLAFGARPYLAGVYRDQYTGDRWISSDEEPAPLTDILGYRIDDWTAPSGWSDVSGPMIDWRFELTKPDAERGSPEYELKRNMYLLTVTSGRMPTLTVVVGRPTTTVFMPPNAISVRHSGGEFSPTDLTRTMSPSNAGALLGDATGSITSQNTMRRGSYYTVDYFAQDTSLYLLDAELIDYFFQQYPLDLTDERLAPYLALPENLPQRVRDLAEAITKDARNPYEKMKALETFISQYPYTLVPGPVPADVDFVDWFLFECKVGYCTYYATALAVMGRCVGVPTRYAEGFTLPATAGADGLYTVTNAQAHAWCDALFSFAGWTTFEATSPFTYPYYHNGRLPTLDPVEDWSSLVEDPIDDVLEAILGREPNRPQTTAPADAQGEGGEPDSTATVYYAIGAGALLLLVLWLRYWLYRRRIKKLESAPPREAAVAYFGRIAGVLASIGQPIEPHETALAYARRIDGGYGVDVEDFTMEDMATIFARASYSAEQITESERDSMARCYSLMVSRPGAPMMERAAAWIERYMLGRY